MFFLVGTYFYDTQKIQNMQNAIMHINYDKRYFQILDNVKFCNPKQKLVDA